MIPRAPGACGLVLVVALATTPLSASGALAADNITKITILPQDPVTAGRNFTVRVEGALPSGSPECGIQVFVGNNWTSKVKVTPFPVDFVFLADFTPYTQNVKFVAGAYDVTAQGRSEDGKNNPCSGNLRIQVHVKPPQANLGPPAPRIPKEGVYPPK